MPVKLPREPKTWKFWGTSLRGLFIFAALFVGQLAVVLYLILFDKAPLDFSLVKTVLSSGTAISLSVLMGLPAVCAAIWLATHFARTPFADYIALRGTSWKNYLLGTVCLIVLVAGWDLLSRGLGRDATPGFMIDVLRSAQGRRHAVASGAGVLRRRAGDRGAFRSRLSLPWLVGVVICGRWAPWCCHRRYGPRCTCNTTGSSSARCFPSACCAGDRPQG